MQQNNIGKIAVVALFLLGAVYLIVVALAGHGNQIAAVAKYLAPVCLIIAFINGKIGLHLLILAVAFSDLLKRTMVLYGNFNYFDITYILMAAPMIMAGIFAHYFIARFIGGRGRGRVTDRLLFGSLILTAVSAVSVVFLQSGGGLDGLKNLAHKSAYIPLMWVIAVAFNSKEELMKFFRFMLWVFVPVAIWGVRQGVFGFTDWEYDYLMTGYSIEVKYLVEEEIHAFSTMNSARAYGITMAYCFFFTICYYRSVGKRKMNIVSIVLLILFAVACFYSMKRASWMALVAGIVGLAAFGSIFRTRILYVMVTVAMVTLIASSGYLLKNWDSITAKASEILPRSMEIAPFSARLVSLNNLVSNSEMWTLFGVSKEEADNAEAIQLGTGRGLDNLSSMLAHDALSKLLLNYGSIIFVIAIFVVIFGLKWLHSLPFRIQNQQRRKVFVILLSLLFAGLSSGLTSGTFVFPINAMLYVVVGCLVFLMIDAQTKEMEELEQREKEGAMDVLGYQAKMA